MNDSQNPNLTVEEIIRRVVTAQPMEVTLTDFLIDLLLAACLCYLLGRVYVRFGHSLSNRAAFSRDFLLMGTTTMLIITVVKSSLALSLGLVGALSIVRFRAAIKEPEELAYLFLTIAIGLGFGANQRVISIVAFVVIVSLIMLGSLAAHREREKSVNLTVCSRNPRAAGLESIVHILQSHCREVDLRRFDSSSEKTEASFLVEVDGVTSIESLKTALHQLDESMNITLLDSKVLGNFA